MAFVLMFCNGFFSFPPSEIVLSFLGYTCFIEGISVLPIISLTILGNFIGTSIWYYVGVSVGYNWVIRLSNISLLNRHSYVVRLRRYFIPNEQQIVSFVNLLNDKGIIWIGILRCFPLIRSIISFPAGIIRMKKAFFYFYTIIGILIWSIFWILGGFYLGKIWVYYNSFYFLIALIFLITIVIGLKIFYQKIANIY